MLKIKRFVAGVMGTNTYLVYNEGGNEAVIIDPVRGKDKIQSYADSLGLKVTAVFITHGHFDHIIEAFEWQKDGATVYVHEDDADRLNGGNSLGSSFGVTVPPCDADYKVKDGQTITAAGLTFRVIHTPGHSPGSCCYVIENSIFSGDTLFAGDIGRTDFEGGNYGQIKESVRKLFALPGDYDVYPGHEESTTLENERRYNIIVSEI